jgi:hypothetical protein
MLWIFYKLYLCFFEFVDLLICAKIKTQTYIKSFYYNPNEYKLTKALLYIDLENNIDVTNYFKQNKDKIKKITRNTFLNIYHDECCMSMDYNKDIRLKIFFSYNGADYIIYISFQNILDGYIPYPPYSENILKNYRSDIIEPLFNIPTNKKMFYSLFNIEAKDILYVKINNKDSKELLTYFNKLKTPFNDFGILYGCKIKLKWVLAENGIFDYNDFCLKFLNMYFDEEEFDLKEHIIEFEKDDLDKYIISKRMRYIINLKNKSMQ